MIAISVDVGQATGMTAAMMKQVPFAASRAVNVTANDFRDIMRRSLPLRFTIRKRGFMERQINVTKYSDKREAEIHAVVSTGAREGSGTRRDLLGKFEEGGTKRSADPTNPVAVPSVNLRTSPQRSIPLAMYPKNLRLVPRKGVVGIIPAKSHVTKRGVVQLKGLRRAFVLDPSTMFGVKTWGIYQRVNKSTVRLLWTFKRSVPIPRRLRMLELARTAVPALWSENFAKSFADAMRTAK